MKAFTMKALITPSILALLAAASPARTQAAPVLEQLAAHNVVWDSPSADMHGSMPIGNGDLAANFWVEPSGDLVFYLSKSDSWDGDQELLKLGRVRIRLDKPFVRDGRPSGRNSISREAASWWNPARGMTKPRWTSGSMPTARW